MLEKLAIFQDLKNHAILEDKKKKKSNTWKVFGFNFRQLRHSHNICMSVSYTVLEPAVL